MRNALSPDTRDALLAELRRRTTTDGFHFLSADHIATLNEATSPGSPILSLYMELTPEMRQGGTWRTVFKDLCDQATAEAGDHETAVKAQCDRIAETLVKLEEDVIGKADYPVRRAAHARFGEPIDIQNFLEAEGLTAKSGVEPLTHRLWQSIQEMLDEMTE